MCSSEKDHGFEDHRPEFDSDFLVRFTILYALVTLVLISSVV